MRSRLSKASVLVLLAAVALGAWPSPADRALNRQPEPPNGIPVWLEDNALTFDVRPAVVNGRLLIPMHASFEACGAAMERDPTSLLRARAQPADWTLGENSDLPPAGLATPWKLREGTSNAADGTYDFSQAPSQGGHLYATAVVGSGGEVQASRIYVLVAVRVPAGEQPPMLAANLRP